MLEALALEAVSANLCRLANMHRRTQALDALGLTFADREEALAFLGGDGDPNALLDAPFRHDPTYAPEATRFSDGSWRVFYGAADWDTVEAEVGSYHVRRGAVGVPAAVPMLYQRLECQMDGSCFDLRTKASDWPFLIDGNEASYPECQAVAREARETGAAALVTLSARRTSGVNFPVFVRGALSNPRITGSAAVIAEAGGYRIERR